MCGRFDTSHLTWAQIHDALLTYSTVATAPQNIEPNDDVRPTNRTPAARIEGDQWVVEQRRWQFIPSYQGGKTLDQATRGRDGKTLSTFNAKTETVATSGMFRHAFANRRCVVPASAWFEWTGEKGAKVKHRFARADGQPIWFAGIYERADLIEGPVDSFTILTGPGAGWLLDYHTRAPVILDVDDFARWLGPADGAAQLLHDVGPERFTLA